MTVTVKLFATFRQGRKKIMQIDMPMGATAQQIVDALEIERAEVAILLINGRDGCFDKELNDGDVVSIFPPIGGG